MDGDNSIMIDLDSMFGLKIELDLFNMLMRVYIYQTEEELYELKDLLENSDIRILGQLYHMEN